MERSGTIVAINTDPAAPIMRFCDLAVVADVATVLPRLIELLGERQESGAP
jgi:electron transfer flavoprotein alpha subunit